MMIKKIKLIILVFLGLLLNMSMCIEQEDNIILGDNHKTTGEFNDSLFMASDYNLKFKFSMESGLEENSGMVYSNDLFWVINDGGNGNVLYGLDPGTGSIRKHFVIENAKNTDWEDIAQDENNIYIGDIGNNTGKRQDLTIYKVSKAELEDSGDTLTAGIIQFYYEDQESFIPTYRNTPFDCEAMISAGDSLYIYTKDWENNKTALYKIPKTEGEHVAVKISESDVNCLITGADYDEERELLLLIGYYEYMPVIFLSKGSYNLKDSQGTIRHVFSESLGAQTEGIAVINDSVYITCEKSIVSASAYILELE